jgi:hypothetical protein
MFCIYTELCIIVNNIFKKNKKVLYNDLYEKTID